MESKTKHRILGILVVAGFAVLMYPFVIGSSNAPNERAMVSAPPFPDQATQVTSAMSDDVINMPVTNEETASVSPEPDNKLVEQPTESASNDVDNHDPHLANVSIDQPITSKDAESSKTPQTVSEIHPAEIKAIQKKISTKRVKKLVQVKKPNRHKSLASSRRSHKSSLASIKNAPIDNNGLLELKQAAYVIQLGSFKQKTNALKLVNKLRANGYPAFIQNVRVSSGQNTRVFVGPEHRQASARQVATDLEKDMKLRGIVIRYQPFTL